MKRYKYFVSWHGNKDGGSVIGNSIVFLPHRIETAEDIRAIEAEIKEYNGRDSIILLNYTMMGWEVVEDD